MKKTLFLALTIASLGYGGEVEYGHGHFSMEGGFIGLDKKISTHINSYTLKTNHKNILGTDTFYRYNITWYDSKELEQLQSKIQSYIPVTIPALNYKYQGLDANFGLGYDVIHNSDNEFLGIDLNLGVSTPWIDTKKDNSSSSKFTIPFIGDSKTKFKTLKIGPNIIASYPMPYLSIFASATWAYQYAKVENTLLDSSISLHGEYVDTDVGIRFTPFEEHINLGKYVTISPKLYFTAGYRYCRWKLNDMNLDITGNNIPFKAMDFKMDTSVVYLAIGYDF